jgi:membrane metallo-endopeptidase-like protein 1
LARDHYKACTNEEKLEELGVAPMLSKIQRFGGWPAVEGDKWNSGENWNSGDNFSVWEWTYKMNEEGLAIDHLLSFSLEPDDKNSSWRVIELDQADLGMSREYLVKGFEDKDVQHYYRYMVDTAILFGAKPDDAKREMRESLLFEIELAHITAPREDRRNSTQLYNPTTAGEAKTHEGLPPSWTEYIQTMMSVAPEIKIDENEKIVIASPEYLENLGNLLTKTDKRTLGNYLAWRAAKASMIYLNEEARKIRHRYRKAIQGILVQSPTWKRCVEEIGFNNFDTDNFIYVASSMYVKKYFKPEAKKEMIELSDYIRKSFEDTVLPNIDWMDERVKERAKKKLAEMEQFIAYSDEFLDKDKVDNLHKGLVISPTDLVGNAINLYKFWRKFERSRLREKIDRRSWLEHSYVALVNFRILSFIPKRLSVLIIKIFFYIHETI